MLSCGARVAADRALDSHQGPRTICPLRKARQQRSQREQTPDAEVRVLPPQPASQSLRIRNWIAVCTENSVRVDYVSESPNVSDDDRSVLPLPGPVRLAVQVEEPTW